MREGEITSWWDFVRDFDGTVGVILGTILGFLLSQWSLRAGRIVWRVTNFQVIPRQRTWDGDLVVGDLKHADYLEIELDMLVHNEKMVGVSVSSPRIVLQYAGKERIITTTRRDVESPAQKNSPAVWNVEPHKAAVILLGASTDVDEAMREGPPMRFLLRSLVNGKREKQHSLGKKVL